MTIHLNDQRELLKKVSDYCDKIANIPQYNFSKFVDPLALWKKQEERTQYRRLCNNSHRTLAYY